MDEIHIFGKKREFIEWATSIQSQTTQPDARAFVGYEPISWSLKGTIAQESQRPAWAITGLPLPIKASQAKQVWDSVQEENLCLFFYLELHFGVILVGARNGAWRSLDDRHLPHKKDAFTELSDDDAKKLVIDKKAWSELVGEVQLFGMGCRVLLRHSLSCGGNPAWSSDVLDERVGKENVPGLVLVQRGLTTGEKG